MHKPQQDLPDGVKKARRSDPALKPQAMTGTTGQFTNANNNLYPVPTNYVDGVHEEIDTRTGKAKDKGKGQATLKTNLPPEERPESANS